jgi:hypothetical protein
MSMKRSILGLLALWFISLARTAAGPLESNLPRNQAQPVASKLSTAVSAPGYQSTAQTFKTPEGKTRELEVTLTRLATAASDDDGKSAANLPGSSNNPRRD